ncbi:DUF2690 domain-containing protein [Nocardia noduli]|uniref:DUF2690 domain-containing protein n=1 Tax=Nocardia noduli TaxID=2815722 RepID=UPI0020B40C47|nr:DUF2690 domain-containing protein [Nocardia noduli]
MVVGLVITNAVTALVTKSVVDDDGEPAHSLIATGGDPLGSACLNDFVTAGLARPEGGAFELKLLYSAACNAAWAKVNRLDGAGYGERIKVAVFQFADPQGRTRQWADELNVDQAYTMVIVRQDPTDRLCATASVSRGPDEVAIEQPVCM